LADDNGEIRKYFKDWTAVCRPDGYCAAATYLNPAAATYLNSAAATPAIGDYVLGIGRPARQTYWEVSFTPTLATADAGKGFTATVDGDTLAFSFPAEIAPYGATNDFFFLGDKAQTLLDRLVPASSAGIAFTDAQGQARLAPFSLAGIGAALIWIDGMQGRIGSERVTGPPPYGLFRADVPGADWMEPALAFFQ
jgi:hypothetical protein